MNCRRVRKRIPLYAGRDLDALEAAQIDVHVRHCLSCYREVAAFEEGLDRLRALSHRGPKLRDVDARFTATVMERVSRLPPPTSSSRQVSRWAGWAAAAALLVGLGLHATGVISVGSGSTMIPLSPPPLATPASGGLELVRTQTEPPVPGSIAQDEDGLEDPDARPRPSGESRPVSLRVRDF